MLRRRARFSAALICAVVSLAAAAGSGALASSSRASAEQAQVVEGLQRGREEVPQLVAQPRTCRVRSQISVLCARATTLTACAAAAVPGDRPQLVRIGADHVRQHVPHPRCRSWPPTPHAAPGTGPPAAD